jgi:hypothetical protein
LKKKYFYAKTILENIFLEMKNIFEFFVPKSKKTTKNILGFLSPKSIFGVA